MVTSPSRHRATPPEPQPHLAIVTCGFFSHLEHTNKHLLIYFLLISCQSHIITQFTFITLLFSKVIKSLLVFLSFFRVNKYATSLSSFFFHVSHKPLAETHLILLELTYTTRQHTCLSPVFLNCSPETHRHMKTNETSAVS